MPIDFTNLPAEDAAATHAAIEASQKNCEERECCERVELRVREAEECACREVAECRAAKAAERRAVEAVKEVEARKEEAEQKTRLLQDKRLQEEAGAEERQQALSLGLSGLKLMILAPSIISHLGSGLSTQSKGKWKVMEEALSTSS
jgi:hypothetical protein